MNADDELIVVNGHPSRDLTSHLGGPLICGEVHKALDQHPDRGGAGHNIALALAGNGDRVSVFGFIGMRQASSFNGPLRGSEGIVIDLTPVGGGDTRLCIYLVEPDGDTTSILVPSSFLVLPHHVSEVLGKVEAKLRLHAGRWLIGSGSLAPGLDTDFYYQLGLLGDLWEANYVVDTREDALLEAVRLGPGRIKVLKMNRGEAAWLAGVEPEALRSRNSVLEFLLSKKLAWLTAVTMGSEGSMALVDGTAYWAHSPSTSGGSTGSCGDAWLAWLVKRLSEGSSPQEALASATAAAAAKAKNEIPGLVRREDIEDTLRNVQVEAIHKEVAYSS